MALCVLALVAALALGVVFELLASPEPFDDAFIAFRYAENAVAGEGLVFNRGERVEGFSSPLFMALLVAAGSVGVSYSLAAQLLNGLALASVLVLVAVWLLREFARGAEPSAAGGSSWLQRWSPALGAAAAWAWILLHPSTQLYLSSGLETWCWTLLLLLFAWQVRTPVAGAGIGGRRAVWLGCLATLLAAMRPEGLAAVPVAAAVAGLDAAGVCGPGWNRSGWSSLRWSVVLRSIAVALAVPLLVLGALLLLRLWYYGLPLPNTYYAKIGASELRRLTRGLEYVLREAPWLATPLLLFGLRFARTARASVVMLALWAFPVVFSVYSGGDWMPGSRFLLPAVVATGWMFGRLVTDVFSQFDRLFAWRERPLRLLAVLTGAGIVLGFALLAQLQTVRLQTREADWIHTFGAVASDYAAQLENYEVGWVATGGIGIIGFDGDLPVLDVFGLTEPAIAEAGKWASRGTAGHQSYDGELVWERRPDLLLPHSVVTDEPLSDQDFLRTVLSAPEPNRFWMAEVVNKPGFDGEYRYRVFEPLPGRFVGGFERNRSGR